jgi:diketogulonate reductase-like aldo/keto reductase
MTDVGQEQGGKTNAQVALNWIISKGALPIPGAKTAAQAQENAGAIGWSLTREQVARLDAASDAL